MRIRLVVLDGDAEFLRLLARYVRQTDFAHKFALKTFTDRAGMERYLHEQGGNEETDILLAATHLLADAAEESVPFPVVRLLENPFLAEREGEKAVFKFQPFSQMLAKMLHIHMQRYPAPVVRLSGQCRGQVIAVFSAAGGCGKTTVAYSLARQLALLQQRVLYVNLESFSSTCLLFPENGREANDDFARLMYCLKVKPEHLSLQLPALVRSDPQTQIHYIGSSGEVKEMLDMNREDAIRLVEGLRTGPGYDVILLDLESVCHERIAGALQASDRILWIVTDDVRCLYKTGKWLKSWTTFPFEMSESGKMHFILNKVQGEVVNDFSAENVPIEEQLPFVAEWQTLESCRRLLHVSAFNERLVKMSRRLDLTGKAVRA